MPFQVNLEIQVCIRMKTLSLSAIFNPFYVLISGTLGLFIAVGLFMWHYPALQDTVGQAFVAAPTYYLWVFLFGVLCCLLTIFFLPLWGMLLYLLKYRIYIHKQTQKRKTLYSLILQGFFLTAVVFTLLQIVSSTNLQLNLRDYTPQGHTYRMTFMYVYTFLTALPALLGMFLIHNGAEELLEKIRGAETSKQKLFSLIDELISFRSLLQNYLTVLGIILSLIPINTAGLRAILVSVDAANEQNFPVTNAILFGLIFTILLLLVYIPAHTALTEASRTLRNKLAPLQSLETLKSDLEQRKTLDDLLQTNLGLTQNLKTGLITLFPLVSSLIASILKINLPLG